MSQVTDINGAPTVWSRRFDSRHGRHQLWLTYLAENVREITRLSAAVTRGAELLDGVQPDWFESVSLGTIDLANGNNCICGQVFADAATELIRGRRGREIAEESDSGYDLIAAYSNEFLELDVDNQAPIEGDFDSMDRPYQWAKWGDTEVVVNYVGNLVTDYYGFTHELPANVTVDGHQFGTWETLTALWEVEILARQQAKRHR